MSDSLPDLAIAGFEPFTTIDFPGKLAAIVFLQGCPWRCVYCHNPHMQTFMRGRLHWDDIEAKLAERKGFIDGVVFSGGEPTAQPTLSDALERVRALGLATGLHTNGMFPEKLEPLVPLLDWVGFDIKAPLDDRYDTITGIKKSAAPVLESLKILLAAGIPLQTRTTVDPQLLSENDLSDIAEQLSAFGAPPTLIQPRRPLKGSALCS